MIIGVPKELKKNEHRISVTPATVAELTNKNHRVILEHDAGIGSGFFDEEYMDAGAEIEFDVGKLWSKAEMIYKVKEILQEEYKYLRKNLIIFTYIHSNAFREQTEALLKSGCISIAYEDISDDKGQWPLLIPMSELAGKGGFIAALHYSQTIFGGAGNILANVCGVPVPVITIIGCGHAGCGACELASAFGNKVNMLDINYEVMLEAKNRYPNNVNFFLSNRDNIEMCLKESDVIINCLLWPKNREDHLIYEQDLKDMKKNAMIIDVSCDDAGAVETCHSTSHDDPIYYVDKILHYCVDNIPSAFAHTASVTLSNVTIPFALAIADKGVRQAIKDDKHLRRGLTTYDGKLTLLETAKKLEIDFSPAEDIIKDF